MHTNPVSTQIDSFHTPISDINTTDQQQIQYNPSNLNGTTSVSLITSSIPIKIPVTKINAIVNQSSSQNSDSLKQKSFLENLYNMVSFREKNKNRLDDIRQTRKRLSDSVLTYSQQLSIRRHNALSYGQQQQQQQQQLPNNCNLHYDQQTRMLSHHASMNCQQVRPTLQTIHQRPLKSQSECQKVFFIRHGERVDHQFHSRHDSPAGEGPGHL